jgi:N-acylneuraminate cytidylyltransferase
MTKPIAIIPARGGSKRIPMKNLIRIGNKPALQIAIELALSSNLFEEVIVSTDSSEIGKIAVESGATFYDERPKFLSDDDATTLDTVSHEVHLLLRKYPKLQYVCCIYPVTPLLKNSRLREGFELIQSSDWDYVFAAQRNTKPYDRNLSVDPQGRVSINRPENEQRKTQTFPEMFNDAGQFYWGLTSAWLEKRPILSGNSTFIQLGKYEVFDVDDLEDLEIVRELYNSRTQDRNFSEGDSVV